MTSGSSGADVSDQAQVGTGTRIWALAQVREGAVIGRDCVIGRGAYIDRDVRLGDKVKVQNLAQLYWPADVGDGVFIGPAVVLTNDRYPRAVTPDGALAGKDDWQPSGVIVRQGASIGARAVCVAPVVVGRWALVAAGATVVRDVPDFALVAGTPARFVAWVGKTGRRLFSDGEGRWVCPETGDRYEQRGEGLVEVGP